MEVQPIRIRRMTEAMRFAGLLIAYLILVGTIIIDINQTASNQRRDIINNQAIICHNIAAMVRTEQAEHLEHGSSEVNLRLIQCEQIHP